MSGNQQRKNIKTTSNSQWNQIQLKPNLTYLVDSVVQQINIVEKSIISNELSFVNL